MADVVLADLGPLYGTRFRAEASVLTRALGIDRIAVHHVGSTAVPELVAKPIVDILVVAPSLPYLDARRTRLEAEGLRWRGERGVRGRRYLVRPDPATPLGRATHVHAFAEGHGEIGRLLGFRDALLRDRDLREAYAALKRSLCDRFANDRAAYQEGKAEFIEAVLLTA